jgi:hypothetical protein
MLYGYMAYFDAQEKLLEALKALKKAGYRHLEAITPTPLEGLEAVYGHDERIPWMAFFLGVLGAGLGLFLQVYTTLDYPHNAGGKPLLGWPAFIPVTFEITILTITVGIFLYLLYLNGLPLAAHPAVLAPRYREALVPGGRALLTGILKDRAPLVREAMAGAGFRPLEEAAEGEWVLLAYGR